MNKFTLISMLLVFQISMAVASSKPKTLKVETLKVGKSKFVVRFYGPAEFCDYDSISIQKNAMKAITLKNRCGRAVKESGASVIAEGNWVKAVRLGPDSASIFLLFAEEPSNYVYQTTLVSAKGKPSIAFSGPITGKFQDYNSDGLFDILKEGGHGEPTGKLFSYDPYLVYLQSSKNSWIEFTISEELSKKYSTENHFEWQGSKYDESIQVDKYGNIAK